MQLAVPTRKPWASTRLALAWLVAVAAFLSPLRAADPRFDMEIRAFIESDKARPPVPGGIVFVGSSVFREWKIGRAHV